MSASVGSDAPALLALMEARRHVAPRRLDEPGPDPAQWLALMRAAASAPDHGRIQPWRFILIPAQARARLGNAFAQALLERDHSATPEQLIDAKAKAGRAPLLAVAVCRLRSDGCEDAAIPDDERLVALGAAVQNMLLAAQAMGFASGVTSGQAMNASAMREALALRPDERAVCFVNVGTRTSDKPSKPRPDPQSLFSVLDN